MYRSYTQIFQNFWSCNYFPTNFQSSCTIENSENIKTSLFSSSPLTDSLGPFVSDTNRGHGGAAITGRPKRAGGEAPVRQTAPA